MGTLQGSTGGGSYAGRQDGAGVRVPDHTTPAIPKTRWATTADGASIAYQQFGRGEVTLVVIHPWASHLEVYWEQPRFVRFMQRLAREFRVVHLDKRGMGMSDRIVGAPDVGLLMEDVRAVMDAAGVERSRGSYRECGSRSG